MKKVILLLFLTTVSIHCQDIHRTINIKLTDGSQLTVSLNYSALISTESQVEGEEVSILNPIDTRKITLIMTTEFVRERIQIDNLDIELSTSKKRGEESQEILYNFSIFKNMDRKKDIKEIKDKASENAEGDFDSFIIQDIKKIVEILEGDSRVAEVLVNQ